MPAHLNIIGGLFGIVLGTGAEADDVQKTETVESDELIDEATGEFINVDAINMKKVDVVISGDGPATLTDISAGVIADPSTVTAINTKVSEAPNKRVNFTITAAGHDPFTNPSATPLAVGAEPVIEDLEITSVEYAVAESVEREYAVEDMVLVGTNGEPAFRAKVGVKGTFTVNGRGDVPAGTVLGKGGVEFFDADTGLVLVESLMTGEKRKDWNRWSVGGSHYKVAA